MKKLINKIGVITFILSPIVAIAKAPSSSLARDSSQFKLTQSFQTKLRKSFKNSKWAEQTQGNSGNNINNGFNGAIFEDSHGNLWSMGTGTPLQKYDYQTKRWIAETSDETNSSGSNIISGESGTIFEDSRGNLWSMGSATKLQKYDYNKKRWTVETRLSSNSNITDGFRGIIFEDSRGNLWSMAWETNLQKYDYQTKSWTVETRVSSNSNITDGGGGTLFEDSRGNLWSMGKGTLLQKYNYQTKSWTAETSVSSGSNITNGKNGTIFEDSRGNLWSMGKGTPFQKYDYQTKSWTAERSANSGSNITNDYGGTIFEDSRGNLWSMRNGTPLQKYDYQTKSWNAETSANSGSNITNGNGGTIFEDSRGNLWSMGYNRRLQKLPPTKETSLNNQKVKDFDIEFKTKINSNSKISILIKGYRKYISSLFTHLQYKKKIEPNWKVVKKRTLILDAAEYEFKWVLGTEEILANNQNFPQKIIIKSNGSIKTIASIQPSDITKVKAFLHTLSNETISSLVNNSKWVSEISKLEVLALIQIANGYNALTSAQKALIINEDLISLSEDPAGTLKVAIIFKDENYELIKGGFKLNIQAEANKFKDFISTNTTKSAPATLKVSSRDVLNIFKKISGYQRPTNLASDIFITKAIVKKALNPQTQKVTFELTISRQGQEPIKKDVTVTFKDLKVISKLIKKDMSELSTGAIVGAIFGSVFGIGIIGFLIFYFARRNKK